MSSTLNYPQGCSYVHSPMMKLPILLPPPVLSCSSLGPSFFFCVLILALDMVLPVYLEVGFNSASLLSVLILSHVTLRMFGFLVLSIHHFHFCQPTFEAFELFCSVFDLLHPFLLHVCTHRYINIFLFTVRYQC